VGGEHRGEKRGKENRLGKTNTKRGGDSHLPWKGTLNLSQWEGVKKSKTHKTGAGPSQTEKKKQTSDRPIQICNHALRGELTKGQRPIAWRQKKFLQKNLKNHLPRQKGQEKSRYTKGPGRTKSLQQKSILCRARGGTQIRGEGRET